MKALHAKVDETFGYRQMTLHMNRKFKEKINHKRIYRLMKVSNLRCVIRVKKKQQYRRSIPQHVAENVLNREFTAEKLYLASKKCIKWQIKLCHLPTLFSLSPA
jgi:putative transposase